MSETRYTKDHEWARLQGDTVTVGISDYAQNRLGDIVFVELPEIGKEVRQGDALAVVESVKAASDVYAPVSGEVIEVNDDLNDDPAKVNNAAEGDGWFCRLRVKDAGEVQKLMAADDYRSYLESLE